MVSLILVSIRLVFATCHKVTRKSPVLSCLFSQSRAVLFPFFSLKYRDSFI